MLAIFPALIALMSVVGLVGPSASDALAKNLESFTPGPGKQILATTIHQLGHNRSGAGIAFVVGLAVALWSASGYVAAFMRASNAIWDVAEGRPIWKTIPVRLAVTAFTVVVLAIGSIAVFVTGPIAQRVGGLLGFGSAAVTAWEIAKWPVIILLLGLLLAVLYYAAPNVRHPGFRWVTPGGVLAIMLWIIASAAVWLLRRDLRLVQQDLRRTRWRHRLSGLALALKYRDPARRRVQRRNRAPTPNRPRPTPSPRTIPPRPRLAPHGRSDTTTKELCSMDKSRELFVRQLGDVLAAEQMIVKMLPTLAEEAWDAKLTTALEKHLTETERHVKNVKATFKAINQKPKIGKSRAIKGLKKEHDHFIAQAKPNRQHATYS